MGQDQVSGGVSVLCWLATPVAMFYGNLQNLVISNIMSNERRSYSSSGDRFWYYGFPEKIIPLLNLFHHVQHNDCCKICKWQNVERRPYPSSCDKLRHHVFFSDKSFHSLFCFTMFSMSTGAGYVSDKMSSGDPILVAAIDFGTTFSWQILPLFKFHHVKHIDRCMHIWQEIGSNQRTESTERRGYHRITCKLIRVRFLGFRVRV